MNPRCTLAAPNVGEQSLAAGSAEVEESTQRETSNHLLSWYIMTIQQIVSKYRKRMAFAKRTQAVGSVEAVIAEFLGDLSKLDGVGDNYATTSDVAERFSVSEKTAARWAAEGRFPGAFKTSGKNGEWRIPESSMPGVELDDEEDVEALLEA